MKPFFSSLGVHLLIISLVGCVSTQEMSLEDQGVVPRDVGLRLDSSVALMDFGTGAVDGALDGAVDGALNDGGLSDDAMAADQGDADGGVDGAVADAVDGALPEPDLGSVDMMIVTEVDMEGVPDAAPPPPPPPLTPERAGEPRATPVRGNPGGGEGFNDVCPGEEVLIGVAGEVRANADYIGRLRGICGGLDVALDSVNTVPGAVLPVRGVLGGGGQFGATCPAGTAVVAYSGRAGALMDQLVIHCAEVQRIGALLSPNPGAFPLQPVGGNGGNPFARVDCGERSFAVGVLIRAGDGVDGFGLLCTDIELVP